LKTTIAKLKELLGRGNVVDDPAIERCGNKW
jgi:hypothetical protein